MDDAINALSQQVSDRLVQSCSKIPPKPSIKVTGRLVRVVGMTLEVVGTFAPVGSRCLVSHPKGHSVVAEVVGFQQDRLFLMPISRTHGLAPNAKVTPLEGGVSVPVGEAMLGRVINGHGAPLDGKGELKTSAWVSLVGEAINPLDRAPIEQPLDVGIKAINALLTLGRGQRLGLMAGTGVGKSVLMGMMTRFTQADIVVVGLVGERGREVNDFVRHNLGEEGLKRAVVIASPADDPPLMRLHAAMLATAVAEYFRDQGRHVLLLMDSLTRFAQAQREIALAIGEPPASKGYPPSVFFRLPQLVERAGNGREHSGSITAIYTVLAEGDDQADPIVDAARGVLDGHIVLSRTIAESGRYPAIDIEASISRLMIEVAKPDQFKQALVIKKWLSLYEQQRDLINLGAYRKGTQPELDLAIQKLPEIQQFLAQGIDESFTLEQSVAALAQVVSTKVGG
ncbi:flagellar protein export ATPase FliI [Thiomicrospira sp. ALE5]|uniref:flagellar protein export ATPase FliI n=1 Tax=Thiomicrospira sp. ALE5 TaxID=748650 RepID=UPI0008EDD94D|nr:flagellar protein export ATPase FliI [Thiomicrospira sp. ALE5]SFR59256.1 flagellum-specific ATP synthase [Thiomicrospira sp. ALE5]